MATGIKYGKMKHEAQNFQQAINFDMKKEATVNHCAPPDAKHLLAAGFRYTVYIYFGIGKNHLAEGVKTLKEARTYKEMIDETVRKACIIDKTNGRVVEWWVS